jgi:hypothetical protein
MVKLILFLLPGAISVPVELERGSRFFLTRFLYANRHPLRSKTLWRYTAAVVTERFNGQAIYAEISA